MNPISLIKFWINPKQHYKDNPHLLVRWAKKVYKKDNHTCQRCGYKAGGDLKIEAHHVYPKSKYPKLAYKVSNGATLCERCHRTDKDSYHALNGIKGDKGMFKKWLKETSKESKSNFDITKFLNRLNVVLIIILIIIVVDSAYK